MEKRNVELSLEKAKEWYKQGGELKDVALQAFTEDELKAVSRPHCWFDFCVNYPVKKEEHYIETTSHIYPTTSTSRDRSYNYDQNLCTSKQEAEAFLALMQLRQLRKAWIGDWKPDWNVNIKKYCIVLTDYDIRVEAWHDDARSMSFPTEEMAEEFLHDFKNLIETAKELL